LCIDAHNFKTTTTSDDALLQASKASEQLANLSEDCNHCPSSWPPVIEYQGKEISSPIAKGIVFEENLEKMVSLNGGNCQPADLWLLSLLYQVLLFKRWKFS
jgi:hypothetical protein